MNAARDKVGFSVFKNPENGDGVSKTNGNDISTDPLWDPVCKAALKVNISLSLVSPMKHSAICILLACVSACWMLRCFLKSPGDLMVRLRMSKLLATTYR